ncbi:protein inscuteable homolog isoform X2 [Lineus longissimus]|uniref:protein inscuteable homolog isoform X2 n=1 Tax=Lineus longissimus TaxID=88925 RepID=UPI002B4E1855
MMSDIDSVQQWLQDLRWMTESECMTVLQGKSLTQDGSSQSPSPPPKSPKEHIDIIRGRAHIISLEFSKLFKKLDKDRWHHIRRSTHRLVANLRSLVHECDSALPMSPPHIWEQEEIVMEGCTTLQDLTQEFYDESRHDDRVHSRIYDLLTYLGQAFSKLVDGVLGSLTQNLIHCIETSPSPNAIKYALLDLISLGLDGEHMCYIIAREQGISSLLELCKKELFISLWPHALRAVATVCCVSECVQDLEKANGVEHLTDILNNYSVTEYTRSEAAGVVAQITSPCLDHYHHLNGFLENMEDLTRSLTVLCVEASSPEVFLLGTAAIANITFMDSLACDYLLQFHTAKVLIDASQLHKAESLFAKDQVATVLANMAVHESCCEELMESNGFELLLQFLQESPLNYKTNSEISACERVQQKSAIALTRLSRDPDHAWIIVKCQGLPRLVQLCREGKERNESDSVLVASLAALRKIAAVTGTRHLASEDVQQLIKPRLLESFLMCTKLEETFV